MPILGNRTPIARHRNKIRDAQKRAFDKTKKDRKIKKIKVVLKKEK